MEDIEGPYFLELLWTWLCPSVHMPIELLSVWLVTLLLLTLAVAAARRATLKPGRAQNVVELALEGLTGLSERIVGHEGPRFLPLFATLFLFILTSNWMGLIPGFLSPTSNLSINAGLALIVACTSEFLAVRHKGVFGYVKHLCGPPYWLAPLFAIIRVTEIFSRPLSLTMRLFGNMLAKEIVLGVLVYLLTLFFFSEGAVAKMLAVVPLLLRPAILLLGVLVGIVQALVFTALAMAYVGGAVAEHH